MNARHEVGTPGEGPNGEKGDIINHRSVFE